MAAPWTQPQLRSASGRRAGSRRGPPRPPRSTSRRAGRRGALRGVPRRSEWAPPTSTTVRERPSRRHRRRRAGHRPGGRGHPGRRTPIAGRSRPSRGHPARSVRRRPPRSRARRTPGSRRTVEPARSLRDSLSGRSSPPMVASSPAGEGDDMRRVETEGGSAERDLDQRRAVIVANQPVRQPGGPRIGGAANGHAKVSVPRTANGILDRCQRARLDHLDHGAGSKRTTSPGTSSVGGFRRGSKRPISVRPMIRQPPGRSAG